MNKTLVLTLLLAITVIFTPTKSEAREQIRVVGSSTVYPFSTVVAEEFGTKTDFRTPVVESTGTGGGFKLFCSGKGDDYPDVSNASREIKASEIALCKSNGISNPIEIQIGFDGIALASSVGGYEYSISQRDIFYALAKQIPINGKLVDNPNQTWKDVNAALPDNKIEIYGPPPTSGTRDAFVEIVMEGACLDLPEFVKEYEDKKVRKKYCHQIREDGRYIESGENDNLIVQKLKNNTNALGIFGFGYLDQNEATIQGATIDGVKPTFDNIASGDYGISRSLFIYAKKEHLDVINGLREFLNEFVSDEAISDEGYLSMKGLIPLKEDARIKQSEEVGAL